MKHTEVLDRLRSCIRPEKAEFLPGFFQAYPGGYGEGDKFLGVVVPDQRKIAREFRELPISQIKKLMQSAWHECRLTGLLILVGQFENRQASADKRTQIVNFYLDNFQGVNNWDLVDCSAHKILGAHVLEFPKEARLIKQLAKSSNMWKKRAAVIATLPLIKSHNYQLTLELAEQLVNHQHDLMHKAIGWMLREIGNRDANVLRAFLNRYVQSMPRVMLRYSIEKLDANERKHWLSR